ncbi:ABC transporter substrate-binding protein [Xylophilus sp. GW821-FHT01B05]
MTLSTWSRRRFSTGLMAGGAVLATAAPRVWAQGDTRIVLGQSASLTGPTAQLGLQYQAGAKLCFDQVNAQGGVGRRTIELRSLDDGYEPERCAANTRKLIDEDALALFGYVGTPTTLAALPLANQARVPLIAPLTGAMALREPFHRNLFHLRASYDDETALIVRQLTNLGLTRIAVFHQNDTYGKAGLDGVVKALAAQKLQPAGTVTVERNSEDVSAAVKQLSAAWPEAVVQVGTYAACAAFVRAARKAGYGGTFYNVSFVGTQALADALGKEGAGVVVSQVLPSPYKTTHAAAREFLEAVKKGSGVAPNYSSFEGYLAARVLVEGLRRARTPDREGLIAGLEGIGTGTVAGFPVSFGVTDHVASHFVELSMLTGDGKVRA